MRVICSNGLVYDSNDYLSHHGILGQRWGKMQGPPYPLGVSDHSAAEKKAGYKKSLGGGRNEELYDRKAKTSTDDTPKKKKPYYQLSKKSKIGKMNYSAQKMLNKLNKADKQNAKEHEHHNEIAAEVQRTGKSAAEIEHKERIKKAIAVGAIIAGTAMVTYSSYKLYNELNVKKGKGIAESTFFKNSVANNGIVNNGKSDFLSKAFEGNDFIAVDSSTSSKAAINDILTKPSGEWWNGLTKSEQHAIEQYSGNAYTHMNNALWAAKGGSLGHSYYSDMVRDAQSALDKSYFPKSMVVTQGLSMEKACSFLKCSKEQLIDAANGGTSLSKMIGKVNTNYGLMSTTSTASGGGFSGGVKYKILLPEGAKAAYIEHISYLGDLGHPPSWNGKTKNNVYGTHSYEFETLIKAGSNFKTKGIQYNEKGGFIEVALEYVSDRTKPKSSAASASSANGLSSTFNVLKEAGWTYEEISKAFGIPKSTIEYYVNQ